MMRGGCRRGGLIWTRGWGFERSPITSVRSVDFDDEEAAEAWLLWAKATSACGANLTVSCVLEGAAAQKHWSAGGIEAPVA